MRVLELGCGTNPYRKDGDTVVHLDRVELPDVDVLIDLNTINPLRIPLPSKRFDHIRAYDFIEHIIYVDQLMAEIWRVLDDSGTVYIHTANHSNPLSFRDLSHFHQFTIDSMDVFDPMTDYGKAFGFMYGCHFTVLSRSVLYGDFEFRLCKIG